jgi:hypothetical protein
VNDPGSGQDHRDQPHELEVVRHLVGDPRCRRRVPTQFFEICGSEPACRFAIHCRELLPERAGWGVREERGEVELIGQPDEMRQLAAADHH